MKPRELIEALQKLIAEHPEAAELEILTTGGACQYPVKYINGVVLELAEHSAIDIPFVLLRSGLD